MDGLQRFLKQTGLIVLKVGCVEASQCCLLTDSPARGECIQKIDFELACLLGDFGPSPRVGEAVGAESFATFVSYNDYILEVVEQEEEQNGRKEQ